MNKDPYFEALQKKNLVLDLTSPEDVKKCYEEKYGNSSYLGWIPMLCVLAQNAKLTKGEVRIVQKVMNDEPKPSGGVRGAANAIVGAGVEPEKNKAVQEVIDREKKGDKV